MQKLEGKPFALIGLNGNNGTPNKLKAITERENLNWRSIPAAGAIWKQWNNPMTPGYYLLDHRGVIRHKWMGYPGEHALETSVERLLKAVPGAGDRDAGAGRG